MFPLAFVAGSLQGHWWGFISRNYVVWPISFLMNVFIALKGTHFFFFIEILLLYFHVFPQECISFVLSDSIFEESFLSWMYDVLWLVAPKFVIFPVLMLMITIPIDFLCAVFMSSLCHVILRFRLMRFSLIGACLFRTEMKILFHEEKLKFWEQVNCSIFLLHSKTHCLRIL